MTLTLAAYGYYVAFVAGVFLGLAAGLFFRGVNN